MYGLRLNSGDPPVEVVQVSGGRREELNPHAPLIGWPFQPEEFTAPSLTGVVSS